MAHYNLGGLRAAHNNKPLIATVTARYRAGTTLLGDTSTRLRTRGYFYFLPFLPFFSFGSLPFLPFMLSIMAFVASRFACEATLI